jgi:hypothetical protein
MLVYAVDNVSCDEVENPRGGYVYSCYNEFPTRRKEQYSSEDKFNLIGTRGSGVITGHVNFSWVILLLYVPYTRYDFFNFIKFSS